MFCIPWTCVICLKEPSITSRFHATGSSMFTIYLFKSMHAWSAWLHVGLGSLSASGLSFVSESPTFITTTFATFPCHLCVHHSPENVFITHIKEVGSCLCCRIEEFGDIHMVGVLECTGILQIIQGQVDKPFCKFSYGINRTWGIQVKSGGNEGGNVQRRVNWVVAWFGRLWQMSVRQKASLVPTISDGYCVDFIPSFISKVHCFELINVVNLRRSDAGFVLINGTMNELCMVMGLEAANNPLVVGLNVCSKVWFEIHNTNVCKRLWDNVAWKIVLQE